MDFKNLDPKFDNNYPSVGPEFGDLHARRDEWIAANRATYSITPSVPLNIPGLVRRTSPRVPSTQRWFVRTTTFERNGFFNIHTPAFNTKLVYLTFFWGICYGNLQYVLMGISEEEHEDNYEHRRMVYDKLSHRELPFARVWQRPC